MLRLQQRVDPEGHAVISIEGQLSGEWVQLTEEACMPWLNGDEPRLTLDLGSLRRAEASGLRLLRRLRVLGARLERCPPLIAAELEEADDAGDD